MFKKGKKEEMVYSVHIAVYKKTLEELDLETLKQFVEVQPEGEIKLQPEEMFIALKSFFAGILDIGIMNAFINGTFLDIKRNEKELPELTFGFNFQFRGDFSYQIQKLIPERIRQFIKEMVLKVTSTYSYAEYIKFMRYNDEPLAFLWFNLMEESWLPIEKH